MVINSLSIDVEEHFQVSGFEGVIDRDTWESLPSRVVDNTRRILRLLDYASERASDGAAVKATFFILGWIADRQPALVREIADAGHDIASHGYWHRLVYTQTPDDFRDDVARSIDAIERACGQRPIGYRAPSFSITEQSRWAWPILADLDMQFDSSVFPTNLHNRYGMGEANTKPHEVAENLWEIPMSVLRVARWNVPVAGGGYFRLYPFWITRSAVRRLNAAGTAANVYLHPWEFDPQQPRIAGVGRRATFRHYVNIHRTQSRLRRLLAAFPFGTMRQAYADVLSPALHAAPS
ncbi:MAG: XrtA system polysaccharide deacetylase [Pirellulales bacterium]